MRVFVTGASGWIGSALVPELVGASHQVVGLARSDDAAAALAAVGVEVVRGSLDDLDLLRATATAADGVIHLAFKHDLAFTGNFQGATDADALAIDAFGEALAGTDRPFVIASGVLGLAAGRTATELDGHGTAGTQGVMAGGRTRMTNAETTLSFAAKGVRSSVVRLPPTVHGDGDPGFIAMVVEFARQRGASAYIGDGANRWPAAHVIDAARLFRLALEQAPAGSTLHAIAEQGVPIRDVAEVIGRHLELPVVSIAAESATEHFTWLGGFLSADAPTSSAATRELLGWQPTQHGLIEDLEQGHYFRTPSA